MSDAMIERYRGYLARAVSTISRAQCELDTVYALPVQLDEISILFKDQMQLAQFTSWAIGSAGLEPIGTSTDRPFSTTTFPMVDFSVKFEFMAMPDVPWRVEAMWVGQGAAPLHHAAPEGAIMHASYKVSNLAEYTLAKAQLVERGIPFQQEYRSFYGMFSYWGVGPTYFKPRVNLSKWVQSSAY